jgi:hypothetical protein
MGYVLLPGGLSSYKFTFTGLQIQTCGSVPLSLDPLGFDTVANRVFIPYSCTLVLKNTSVPFDFSNSDHLTIADPNISNIYVIQYYDQIQNLSDNRPTIATFQQVSHNNRTFGTNTAQYSGVFLVLTTETGNDATQGDSEVELFISGIWQNLN